MAGDAEPMVLALYQPFQVAHQVLILSTIPLRLSLAAPRPSRVDAPRRSFF